ncbi:MAG: CHRD domain-containing protein, partial [Phycicoccus sp.]
YAIVDVDGVYGAGEKQVPTKLHLHQGARGTNGDVAVDFTDVAVTGKRTGCVWVDPAIVKRIIANPQNYYLNYHTAAFLDGAIRGQLG